MNEASVTLRALHLAESLMQGDPASFKDGYTLENAALAAQDFYGLDEEATAMVRRMLVHYQLGGVA